MSRVPSPGAPRVLSLRSFTGELPPAAQAGAVAPRVLAAPLRWRLGAPTQRANPNAGSAGGALRLLTYRIFGVS